VAISVVVVTVGQGPLLERCVRSIGAGELLPEEVVVVDQGPPGLKGLLEEWLSGSGVRARHVEAGRVGVSCARNLGVEAASAEHVAFTDDDCVPHLQWLAALAAAIDRSAAQAATGRVLPLDEGRPGLVAVSSRTDTRERTFRRADDAVPWDAGTGGNLLVGRDRFRELGGFDPEYGPGARFRTAEDVELLERLLHSGAAIAYAPAAIVYHQMKPRAGRFRRRFPYGYGMGAMVARADRDRRAFLARRYLAMQAKGVASGMRRASPRRILESIVMCIGFAGGLADGGRRRSPTPLPDD
jgi:GT2 family glycosyltransferase